LNALIGGTDKGLVRTSNQDRYEAARLGDALLFAVLCDGMGGENGGDVASEIAVSHCADTLRQSLAENLAEPTLRGIMQSAVSGANSLVHSAAEKDPALSGMGTTMIAAVLSGGVLYVSHVGDSRVYIVSPAEERQLSRDHTMVQMLVDLGEITEEAAKSHPQRHFVTRAVGVAPTVDSDFIVEPIAGGELVLLCSDGLYNYLTPGSYYALLKRCVEEGSVQSLIDLAKEAGGADNITAVVMAMNNEQ
jgi:protein phosphatase